MRIVLTGSSGFVGRALAAHLSKEGAKLVCLQRASKDGVLGPDWDPKEGRLDPAHLEEADAVIGLSGAGIADRRWTPARRLELRQSRLMAVRTLVQGMARCAKPPRCFLCASAIGYYGTGGEALFDEQSGPGEGFLAELCAEWEAEARRAQTLGVRVVHLRLGMVLGSGGGALSRLLPLFRMGLGGPLGQGRRWMSWISLEDLVRAIEFLLRHPELQGAVNAVAPTPVRNFEFTKALGTALHRPTLLSVPPVFLRAVYGDLASELLLSSQRVLPGVLQKEGFEFKAPELSLALKGFR